MKSFFTTMAKYNAWANARVYGMARELPDELYRRKTGAFFGSMHGTLNHLLVTDRIWMRRFTGEGPQPSRLNEILFEELAPLEEARKAEDERIVRYVDSLAPDSLPRDHDYKTTAGVPHRNVLQDLLMHFFNHQTHHRGQAHMILTVLGVPEPTPLDLLAMYRDLERQGATKV